MSSSEGRRHDGKARRARAQSAQAFEFVHASTAPQGPVPPVQIDPEPHPMVFLKTIGHKLATVGVCTYCIQAALDMSRYKTNRA